MDSYTTHQIYLICATTLGMIGLGAGSIVASNFAAKRAIARLFGGEERNYDPNSGNLPRLKESGLVEIGDGK
jgi:hypothetical protein